MKSKTKVGLFLATLLSLSLSAHDSSAHEHNDHKLGDQLKADADLKSGSQEHEHDSKLASFIGVEEYISFSGTIGLYGQTMDANDDNIDRDELAAIYGALHLETREWQGFRLGLTALAHGELHDHNDNYNEYYDNNAALLAEAFLKYNYKETEFTLGRQGVDWLMLGDYFEGVFVESEAIEDFLIRAAWVHKGAVFDPDEVFDYDELNDDDGVFGTEITYNGIEGLAITGLYYQAPDAYDIYGGEVFHEYAFCDKWSNAFLVQYFETDEKSSFADYPDGDGSIFHVNNVLTYEDLSFGGGYIEAADGAGAGNMLNNPWDPFEEDTHTDRPNSETWYVQAEYAVNDDLTLSSVYGESDTDEGNGDAKFKEFNFVVAYQVCESLLLEAAYINLTTTDDADEGFDKLWIHATYEF